MNTKAEKARHSYLTQAPPEGQIEEFLHHVCIRAYLSLTYQVLLIGSECQ